MNIWMNIETSEFLRGRKHDLEWSMMGQDDGHCDECGCPLHHASKKEICGDCNGGRESDSWSNWKDGCG